jgi:2'-5' RNA ligase
MSNLQRLFVAINFNEHIKDSLTNIMKDMKTKTKQGSFTHRENLHLTLAFIGETTGVESVKIAMDHAINRLKPAPIALKLLGFGTFKRNEGDIIWVGVEKNLELTKLHRILVEELKKEEFEVEDREYKPHLTLGRRVKLNNREDMKEYEKRIPSLTMVIDKICLMKSERIEGKLVYTEIYDTKFDNTQLQPF